MPFAQAIHTLDCFPEFLDDMFPGCDVNAFLGFQPSGYAVLFQSIR